MPRLSLVTNDSLPKEPPRARRPGLGILRRLRLPSPLHLVIVAPSLLAGCTAPNQLARSATRVAFEDLERGEGAQPLTTIRDRPVVIHFRRGQVVPVDFVIESKLFELDIPELELKAKRDFFLLVHADGPPLLSEDGIEFEERPRNSFMFGFSVRKGEKTTLNVGLAVRPEEASAPK